MSLIDLLNKKSILPLESEALRGRDEEVEVPSEHFVKGTPLMGPFESNLEQIVFGMGCFWGKSTSYEHRKYCYGYNFKKKLFK